MEDILVRVHTSFRDLMRLGRVRKSQLERYFDLESHPRHKVRPRSEAVLFEQTTWHNIR